MADCNLRGGLVGVHPIVKITELLFVLLFALHPRASICGKSVGWAPSARSENVFGLVIKIAPISRCKRYRNGARQVLSVLIAPLGHFVLGAINRTQNSQVKRFNLHLLGYIVRARPLLSNFAYHDNI